MQNPSINNEQPALIEYEEVNHSVCEEAIVEVAPKRKAPRRKMREGSVCCNKFYIDDKGVINLSQRDLTLTLCTVFTVYLLTILVIQCTNGTHVCDSEHWPMISDLIKTTFYTRIFCILSTIVCYECLLGNVRAFYKRIAPFTKKSTNDALLYIGFAGIVCLPLVGYFDEDNYGTEHGICAGIFFIGFGVYVYWLTAILERNKDKFTPAQQKSIDD